MARRKPAPSLDSFQQRSTVLSAPNLSLPALVSDMEDPQYQLQEQPGQRPLPQAPQYQGGYQHQQLRPYSHPSANVHSHSFDSNGGNFLHVSSPAPSVVMPNQVPPVFQHPQPDLLGARIPSYGNRYQVQSQYDIEKQDYYAPQVHTPRPATAYSERYAPPSIDYGHYAPQRADYYENTSSYSQWDVDSTYATDMGDKEESLTYNEDPDVVQRFGVPPEAPLARRRKKKRKVVLTEGNLVLDLPIPEKLMLGSNNALEEMTSVRYTAVTCDADDFEAERYSLRQNWSGRETELMIGITMFNEDEVLLTRTLYGVMQGISHLCSRKNSKTWGHEAWKKVVVCIISDGRKNIHPRVCDCLAALGVYQEGVMKSRVKDKDVTAHVFEYTTTFALDPDLHFKYPDKGIVPCQIIFCLKEKNAKKINSHRWFFNAFGKQLQPNVCILLDVGTRPGVKSLYHIWKAFDVNSNIGGACGEIAAYKGPYWSWLINPLVAAQNFEYKMSNILDKPFESICGYISVLPGAFSAYRYIALQNDRNGVGPLASYFKGEVLGGGDTDIFTSNMYLAEDRILCFELVAKRNANWVLKYVKSAVGETDVPDSLPEFIMQRRRWLNGSLFAAFYALAHLPQMLRSGHGFIRKIVLVSEAFFSFVSIVFAWFGIANYYLFFVILTTALEDPVFGIEAIRVFNYFSHFAYGAALAGVFILAMGNKPKASAWKYKLATMLFSLLTIYLLACAVVCAIRASQKSDQGLYARMLLSIVATYGIYFAASVLALDPWHMFTSFIPFLILSPMYLNILSIYAFCNLDDISWGTKDDGKIEELEAVKEADAETGMVEVEVLAGPADVNKAYLEALNNIKMRKQFPPSKHQSMVGISAAEKEQNTRNYYANVRTNVLLSWVLTNAILVVFILSDNSAKETFGDSATGSRTRTYMTCVLAFVALTSAVRFIGSTIYLCTRIFTH